LPTIEAPTRRSHAAGTVVSKATRTDFSEIETWPRRCLSRSRNGRPARP
jgi:hypothetical protein